MKKIVFISMLFCLFSSRVLAQHGVSENGPSDEVIQPSPAVFAYQVVLSQEIAALPDFKKRQPGTAFVLSFLVSGAGQFYNRQPVKAANNKIFLVLDNLRVHHSKHVKEWTEWNKNKIELFFLPAYSPEKNPDEYLNCDLKQGLSNKPSPKNRQILQDNINAHMNMLCDSPSRVKKYFNHKDIKYAA